MPEIAKLDEQGVLIAVEECSDDDHKTDPVARTVKLEGPHDMRQRLKGYRWDFGRHCFLPLSAEPLDAAERDTAELVEGLVEAVEYLEELFNLTLPKRTKRALKAFRRHTPRRKEQQVELVVSGAGTPLIAGENSPANDAVETPGPAGDSLAAGENSPAGEGGAA